MPRYEFSEGSSNKFWQIELQGASYTARWGRIGTDGQTQTKSFKNDAEAKRAYDKAIEEKVKKGYELAGGGGEDGEGEDEENFPSEPSATNPTLEKAIDENPDSIEARLVYADWLQSQGDPRGELIVVQHELSKNPKDKKLATRSEQILAKNRARLLGPLAKWEKSFDGNRRDSFTWSLGFIDTARLAFDYYGNDSEMVDMSEGLRAVFAHPSGRFLRELVLGLNREDPDCEYDALLAVIAEAVRPGLKSFFCADFEYPDENEMSWTNLGNFANVWSKVPKLEKLIVQGGSFELGDIVLPELKFAEFRTGGMSQSAVASIARAKWPKIEHLHMWFGDDNYGASGGIDDIQPILNAVGLPKLKNLGLMNSQFAADIANALPGSKILPQLETLDLSMGVLDDAGAARLAEHEAAFKHLKKINLTQNFLTAAGVKSVRKLCADVDAGDQREPYDEDSRYVAVGE